MNALGSHRYAAGCSGGAGAHARSSRVRGDVKARATSASAVRIDVENTSWNSRRIFASVTVAAPKTFVWSALTDYDNLARFIPSLVENRCVERSGNSAVLYQVGAQDVAMGVKFSAAVTLRCCEFLRGGMPLKLLTHPPPGTHTGGHSGGGGGQASSSSGGGGGGREAAERLFPYPATSLAGVAPSDISFELVEGDFQTFRGVWRMQPTGDRSALLSYALYVKPQSWLPVALIQGRIEGEVVRNLEAVSRYAQSQFEQQQQQLQLQGNAQ